MARGIWRHGPLKTFLTRGIPKRVFRPLLYTRADHIHHSFISALLDFVRQAEAIDTDYGPAASFWLVTPPRELFETLFIPDSNGQVYIDLGAFAQTDDASKCAEVSQAYILFVLEQLLSNDPAFADAMRFDMHDLEGVITAVAPPSTGTLSFLQRFRSKCALTNPEADPRDWPIHYVWEICDQVVLEERTLAAAMGKWNEDLFEKSRVIEFDTIFFRDQKERSLKIALGSAS